MTHPDLPVAVFSTGCQHRLAWRNPLGQENLHIDCDKPEHPATEDHAGMLYRTSVTWRNDDRRDFTGDFGGWCAKTPGCVLPAGHPRGCAI